MPISTFLKKPPLLLVVLALLTLSGLSLWLYGNKKNPGHTLRLSGHLEATETDLAFKIPGKIAFIHFEEGQTVKAGEVVAELESQDLSQEVRQAQAALAQARADLEEKQRDYCRLENLYQRRVVAASVRDKAEAAFLMAKELWRQAQEKFALAKEGYRREDIAAALSEAKQAQAALALARTRLGYATLISPMTGVVLKRPAEPGEVVAVGSTVITLGDLDHIWFEGYIPETDLARVRHGQRAAITTDTYPGKQYPAWVSYIAAKAEFTPKSVETFKERVTLVYRTKIRCDNPHHELKPGMPAEAVIFLEPAADQKGS